MHKYKYIYNIVIIFLCMCFANNEPVFILDCVIKSFMLENMVQPESVVVCCTSNGA